MAGGPGRPGPPALPHHGEAGFTTVYRSTRLAAGALAAVDNALDVAHTAFLHRGLFRGRRTPVPVRATVRSVPDGVEAVYEGEPRPPGVVARLLSPEDGVIEHVDRFVLPSIAQVEYGLGDARLVVTSACTPIPPTRRRCTPRSTFRLRLPAAVVRAAVTPVVDLILRQDARVLAAQTANVVRFGGEQFANTPVDVLGPHVQRLVRRAERGEVRRGLGGRRLPRRSSWRSPSRSGSDGRAGAHGPDHRQGVGPQDPHHLLGRGRPPAGAPRRGGAGPPPSPGRGAGG